MGVRFIVGRAGSGRSRHCFDAIVSAMRSDPLGPAIYWILPKQATFSAERELTTLSGLDAFCRARVLSFELLGEEVLTGCGGAAIAKISAIGRQMLLGHLLRSRADDLTFFNGVARQPGLAARLDSAFAELERCGHDPEKLDDIIDELGGAKPDAPNAAAEDNGLCRKLADFRLLYTAYRHALGDDRVDPHRRLEQVLDCIHDYAPLRGASIYIDDFRQFTASQRRMIVALAKCAASVEITLLIEPASPTLRDPHHLPSELNLFHLTECEYRRVALDLQNAGVALEPRIALKEIRRLKAPALRHVERLFDSAVEPQPRSDAVEFIEAADRRSEVDAVARRIRQCLGQGLRLRQIAVLMRDIDDYEPLLAASFREHGIAYFVDRRKTAIHHPLLQFTRSAMRIARSRWRDREAILALLKSGLSGLSSARVDELENYILLHRIDGPAFADPEPWAYDRAPQRDEDDGDENGPPPRLDPSPMDALRRRIAGPLGAFIHAMTDAPAPTVRHMAATLFKLLSDFGVRDTLAGWIAQAEADNDPELRGEHEQVWTALTDLFDQMVDLLGEVEMNLDDFVEVLDVGLERFDLAIPPPTVDQVLVGTVDRTRTPALHTVFILGLNEGQFPRLLREDPMLNDAERETLRGRELLDLDPASTPRQLDERLLGYIAFTSASDRLIVSRAISHDDRPVNPSSFWLSLRRLFPANEITQARPPADAGPRAIGTPRQLITSVMRWARQPEQSLGDQPIFAALYDFLAHHQGADAIGQMRSKAWPALAYRNTPALSPAMANAIYGGGLVASVTRIESFAECPFRHFARYTLRLEPRDRPEVTSMDLGTVYHGILERLVKRIVKENANWCEISPSASREMIAQFAREVGKSLREQIMLSSARSQYLLEHIEHTLDYVCAAQQAVLRHGQFRPAFAELHFGMSERQDSLPPLTLKTPRGRELRLQGKIDRVDYAADSRQVAVIDYKMRGRPLSLAHVYYGLSLQLLTYLLVLDACGEKLFKSKVAPVAAFYAQLLRQFESIQHPGDAVDCADELFDLRIKQRGIFDFAAIGTIDKDLIAGKRSQVVQCQIKKDGDLADPGKSDAANSGAFKALLNYVQDRIRELADAMMDGEISPRPYRMGKTSPCAGCDYRSVCRFDPSINSYLPCPPIARQKVLDKLLSGGTP